MGHSLDTFYFKLNELKHRIGNRDFISQWAVIPSGMDYYSVCALAERDLLKLTFDGIETKMWNPQVGGWEEGHIFCLPVRMTLDNPEVGKWTGIISQHGTKQSRYSTHYFDAREGYSCHGSRGFCSWITGNILYGNVLFFVWYRACTC